MSPQEIVGQLVTKNVMVSGTVIEKLKTLSEEQLTFIYAQIRKGHTDIEALLLTKDSSVQVVTSYTKEITKKKEVQDFVRYFTSRFKSIGGILKQRPELQNPLSIHRVLGKKDSEQIAIIGMVFEIIESKNGHLLITLEDPTGSIRCIVSKNKQQLFADAKDLVCDEVIGIVGTNKEDVIFVERILWPDIPLHKELKKSPDEVYAAFISDVHVGSTSFLADKFERFIDWINGNVGTDEHKHMVSRLKYLFISGDLVAGIGIYPGQEQELTLPSIYDQYKAFADYIKRIPPHIHIILIPGNHDAGRLAEPQPPTPKHIAPDLHLLPNVTFVSNPSMVTIHKKPGFPGFNVFLYHGYSFNFYIANVDSLRNGGGYHRADLVMKFLLKRRHVCPTHTSSPYLPDHEEDPLVITTVPDFFISGDIHYTAVADYNNVTMICGSCWEKATPFQIKLGHDPEPARVPIVNLQTRKVKVLKF